MSEAHTKENNIKENTIEMDDKKSSVRDVFEYFKNRVREVKGF